MSVTNEEFEEMEDQERSITNGVGKSIIAFLEDNAGAHTCKEISLGIDGYKYTWSALKRLTDKGTVDRKYHDGKVFYRKGEEVEEKEE